MVFQGLMGFNPDVCGKDYVPCLSSIFMEFVEEKYSEEENPETTPMEKLEIGGTDLAVFSVCYFFKQGRNMS